MILALGLLGACTSGGLDITAPVLGETDPPVLADDTDAGGGGSALTGQWRSEGADLSPLLVAGGVVRVDATFEAGGDYEVFTRLSDDSSWTLVGSYTLDASREPGTVALEQTSPWADSVAGIWRVRAGVLTWDVVSLALGTPATPDGGFGSSSAGDDNIQTYRRAP